MKKQLVNVLGMITRYLGHGCALSVEDVNRLGEDPSIEVIDALMAYNGIVNNEVAAIPGIIRWEQKDDHMEWSTRTGRLTVKFYNESIVVEAWAGPREERDAEMAFSFYYSLKPEEWRTEVTANLIFINSELVAEKPARLFMLVEIDQQIHGNPLWEALFKMDDKNEAKKAYQGIILGIKLTRIMDEMNCLIGCYKINQQEMSDAVETKMAGWQNPKPCGWRRVNREINPEVMEEVPTEVALTGVRSTNYEDNED